MTIVEGQTGVIVIDPLISVECAQAALNLYQSHRGARKVTGLIYSHSHVDHFGGAQGVLLDHSSANVPILAPEGFMDAALNENIFAGPSMRRRAAFMYGNKIPKGPTGQIGCGLGMTTSAGTISMVPPTVLVKITGEEHVVDGVRIVFQAVPETEAPAEMNFYFPDHGPYILQIWSRYLDETIVLFGEISDVLFAGHNWPTWGSAKIIKLVSEQRDLYGYMHDQTVRLMNAGLTGIEIAEIMTLPPALQQAWHAQGYYGSLSHNIKGIYQKYITWFNGNPAHLWQYPPAEEGKRYLSCMGGVDEVVKKAETFAKEGDLRFATTLLGHTVAAEPAHGKARAALALVFEKLGFGAENATWRNVYLTSAQELRSGRNTERSLTAMDEVNPGLSVEQWLAGLSVRIDGPRAARQNFAFGLHVVDTGEKWKLIMSNGALTYRRQPGNASDVDLTLKKAELRQMLESNLKLPPVQSRGDLGLMRLLLSLVSGADSNEARNSHI
ncbi:uncharacterized protein Z519_04275 [Cladophialophora bantiana CBS 173.52]|uniref:Metallo-beta-lactamase domain-containing protein n=1 Tax=Cladophialophora bantiana (strain ATCC 10958 / CBS 173.52 / CDC B-1940 / NIH 8579) TaxID=1442370 RepID=A0A0D2HXM2_CLAB1|nr:uncharacterized protein Z519_04275 [Cladophialophora bantiana CBS 173.52]KIW95690.1 hypothetical protein Z519_04275 [Cladophialophora bantiana CBS 173.52]